MFSPLNYLKFLFSRVTRAMEARLPNVPARRAISQTIAAAAIAGIIIVGGVLIYILVTATGPTTSTSYP